MLVEISFTYLAIGIWYVKSGAVPPSSQLFISSVISVNTIQLFFCSKYTARQLCHYFPTSGIATVLPATDHYLE